MIVNMGIIHILCRKFINENKPTINKEDTLLTVWHIYLETHQCMYPQNNWPYIYTQFCIFSFLKLFLLNIEYIKEYHDMHDLKELERNIYVWYLPFKEIYCWYF